MRTVKALAGTALAALGTVALSDQAQAADGLGYTDIRLSVGVMPTSDWGGGGMLGPTGGDFDDGLRASAMFIGPICGVLPVGCGTPPRPGRKAEADAATDFGDYDDLAIEEFDFSSESSYSYDVLLGIEASGNVWSNDGEINELAPLFGNFWADPSLFFLIPPSSLNFGTFTPSSMLLFGPGEPEIDYTAGALTIHLGWAFEIFTRTRGRWSVEITPFIGGGGAAVDWTDGFTGTEDDDEGFYWEGGVRVGTYYTFAGGFQVGIDARAIYSDADIELFDRSVDMSTTGANVNVSLGYRF